MQRYTDTEPKLWDIRSHSESRCDEISQPYFIPPQFVNVEHNKKISK